MSKQSTLFKAWRGRKKETSSEGAHTSDAPSTSSSLPTFNPNEIIIPDDDCVDFDNYDDFFDTNDFTDEELLQSYATTDQLSRPSTSNDPTTTSSSSTNLHQKTLAFHVGPSHSVLNSSIIEDDIPGFDPEAGELWIYPTNYPIRDYQFNIVQKALFTNTLVCLPTGLGKTFIAAVVMYNFYRWYPNSKIVFLAPTKPLVTQQIEACYNVMGIPQEHAAEMTGHLPPKERVGLWESRRVFFLTPQVMQNDLSRGTCPAHDVCCVVFDEAHKALGNHAYCQVVKELAKVEGRFRVLALSATPGNDLKAVQQVVTNLQIGHIELRNEDSFDIQRYTHERKVEKIIVPLEGEIADVKNNFLKVLNGVINRLARYGVIYHSNTERMSKYQLLHARDQFRINGAPSGVMPGAIESDFALSISLYHAYELLQLHGMRSFHQFLTTTFKEGSQQSRAKMEVLKTPEFVEILRLLGNRLGREDDYIDSVSTIRRTKNKVVSPRFSITDAPQGPAQQSFFYSHPKLNKLEEVVLDHFRNIESQTTIDLTGPSPSSKKPEVNTRVMIFSQYRESVQEISELLSQHSPLVRVMTFVGHGSGKSTSKGLTQREQTEIVRKFREGGYNTLVATCVGEEGLDIGEVDLIVCFDAAKSPIRLVQRMGRTGRKRDGRIIVMVTEGKEDQIYNKSQSNKKSIHRAIKEGCRNLTFFKQSPRMVPRYISPQVHKMHMTIGEFVSSKSGRKGASVKTSGSSGGGGKASGSGQGKLSFAARKRKGSKCGFLNNDELMCWSNELALSDKESRSLVRSVEQCFPTQTEFLSIAKLKGDVIKSKSGRKSIPSFVDLSTSFGNSSLNSSSTSQSRKKFHLSLNRWTHCQNAPIPTAMTGHSSRTQQLSFALEFIELLNSSEGVGQSYDLEMETFLNRDDVLSSGSQETRNNGETSDIQQKKKKSRQIRKILDDSSDEDDFQSKMVPADKDNTAESASPKATKEDEIVTVEDTEEMNYDDPVNEIDSDDELDCDAPVEEISSHKEPKEDTTAFTAFTASQHVVPRAPSLDSLDWLDEMEPSQMPSSLANKTRIEPKSLQEASCSESVSKKREEFQFVTPKAPPSSRRSRIQASSTPISTAGSNRKRISPLSDDKLFQDSVELFDDLAVNEIFDNFSDTSVLSSSTSTRKPKISECIHPVGGRTPQPFKSITKDSLSEQSSHETNEDCIIIDSDPEDNEVDREESRHKSLPSVHDSPCTSDDSFLQIHGQRRKRACKAINHLLESPSTPPQQAATCVEISADISPSSKENAGTLGGIKKSGSAGEWLSTRQPRSKNVKKVTRFNLSNSSDEDDFDMPLMQRIRKRAKRTSQDLSDHACQSPLADLPRRERRAQPRKRKLLDGFVEAEAEVSSGEGDNEPPSQHQHLQDSNEYDIEDSFINDNSMLTQVSPSQRERVKSGAHTSTSAGSSSGNMYLQSLMSPEDHLFGGRKKGKVGGGGNQYRMVFSQRHQILNHYIKKAGFSVDDDGSVRKDRKRHRRKRSESDEDSDSYDEAEEKNFHFGEEDFAEFSQSQSTADMQADYSTTISKTSSSACLQDLELVADDDRTPVAISRNQKRRPNFLSDSDINASISYGDHKNTSASKRLRLSISPSSKEKNTAHNVLTSSMAAGGRLAVKSSTSTIDQAVVSPSLLASITIKKTAPCFSLGMDDWLSAIEDDLVDGVKREGPSIDYVEEEVGPVGGASDGLLLSQEDVYQLDEGFQDSDTELL